MTRLVLPIVEGFGEVSALPVLLRRLCEWLTPEAQVRILAPVRVSRDKFLNREEDFRRFLDLAAAKCTDAGWILLLLDADDDCPAQKGASLLSDAQAVIPHRQIAVVLANREFEAWYIAAAKSLQNYRGFSPSAADLEVDAEAPRDAKGWMSARMRDGQYRPVTDQAAFASRFDLELARKRSRSFRKLCSEWSKNTL